MQTSEPPISPQPLPDGNQAHAPSDPFPSLPKQKGWVTSNLHQYQGFWYLTRQLRGTLTLQEHFQAQDTDILLVTTPKSGTTWLKAILFALLQRGRYSTTISNDQLHPLLTRNPHDLVPFLELDVYLDKVPDLASLPSPRLFSTHVPWVSLPASLKESSAKFVYLCRNPKDTFVSMWHFTNRLMPEDSSSNQLEDAFDMFCRGLTLSGPFWDHVLGYWNKSVEQPRKVLFLKYEEMKEQPAVVLRRLAEFLGCPFSLDEDASGTVNEILRLCSFENLSSLEVNRSGKLQSGLENKTYFRRGEVGDWRNYLTAEMAERIDQISEEKFRGTGLEL